MSSDSILETLMAGAERAALARAARDVSARYRERGGSFSLQNDTEALAYALTRMPATRAAVGHVLAQVFGDAPKTLLDFGAGPGTAALAAKDRWPDAQVTLIETNAYMRTLAQKLLPAAEFASAPRTADVVIAAYVLNEMPDPIAMAQQLWNVTTDRLILIDTGTPAASAMMRAVRARLISQGAYIHAPCPHALECPFARNAEGWCHFSVRLPRNKLHRALKGADLGYEDEKFTYLIAGRTPSQSTNARIIGYPRIGKVIDLALCKSDGQLENTQISKRDARYKNAKKARWGDIF